MCASAEQDTIQSEDIATMQQYDQEMQTQYADQTNLYSQVNSVLQPILQGGPNQEGFTPAEKNNLNEQVVEGTAENYSAAAKAVGESEAAEGGGESELPTGAQDQMKEEVATSAAGLESQEEAQVEQQDYQQGYSEFENAEEGEMAIATGENPLGYAGATTSAESTAGSEANAIASQNNSWINAAVGAGGAIVGGMARGGTGIFQ
jgi:hypothetical protein